MGIYLNPGNDLFKKTVNLKIYLDKTMLIEFTKGCDSKELFTKFKISETPDFEKHLNQYNVIHGDIQKFLRRTENIQKMLEFLQKRVLKELKRTFPSVDSEEYSLITDLENLYRIKENNTMTDDELNKNCDDFWALRVELNWSWNETAVKILNYDNFEI